MSKGVRGGQRAGSTSASAAPSVAQAAPPITPTPVTPPTPQQVASGNVLPTGGVPFSDFQKMSDDEKADVVIKALGVGLPMFLDDSGLQRFAYFTGMSDKPQVVPDAQLDRVRGTELFRGVRDAYSPTTDIGYSSNDIYKQIRDGDFTMYSDSGGSVHGKAIYFGTTYGTARGYAGQNANNHPIVMRAKITSGRIANESTLHSMYRRALRSGDKLASACSRAGYDSALGIYALAKGYSGYTDGSYYMILNRGCLSMSDETRSAIQSRFGGRSGW